MVWVIYLESQDFRLNERKWLAIDLDEALSFSAVGDGCCGLLLAEALDALGGRHDCGLCLNRAGGMVIGVIEFVSCSRR